MAFNYYAKLKRVINELDEYQIVKIDKPAKTKKFNGEYNYYEHYYKICNNKQYIKYGKFYQLDKLANTLKVDILELEQKIITEKEFNKK